MNFSQQYLQATLFVSLLSVWVLVGLFFYLNHYTKRKYFAVWTVAWLFYALWLTLGLTLPNVVSENVVFVLRQCCVAVSAVFLLWGTARFLSLPARQSLFGLFMLFLISWTIAGAQFFSVRRDKLQIQLPVFILISLASVFAGVCFYRVRKRMPYVGAGMLSLGFLLWGIYLASYPFSQQHQNLFYTGFLVAAVLQLFIAVSMIVLVLEEARYNAEQMRIEIAAVRSEKEALQLKVLTAEEESRSLYDRVRLTEGVQKAYEELRRTQQVVVQQERLRALGQMASGVAHDVNNALSPILGYSELLLTKMADLPETARNYLKTINQSGDDIAHIVARMREFYRRRSGVESLTKVDLNQMVTEVIDLTRPRWRDISQRAGISIEVQSRLEPDLPQLLSDPSELHEALTNLVFNAVDAMPYGGTILLTTRSVNSPAAEGGKPGENRLQIEVRDNGVGMDEKTRQRCLEPFFSTKAHRGGSGLGLAMVYGMMQRHEGTIDIDSSPGKGTTIRLTFPLRDAASPAATSAAQRHPSRSLNVLCIDDELQIRQLLRDSLAHYNHRVAIAANGREGLELFRAAGRENHPFDVVITDMGMPGLDGHQVAKAIKAESPGTPVVMMTGWGTIMREDRETAPEVDALIDKPPRLRQLNDLLLRLAERAAQPA